MKLDAGEWAKNVCIKESAGQRINSKTSWQASTAPLPPPSVAICGFTLARFHLLATEWSFYRLSDALSHFRILSSLRTLYHARFRTSYYWRESLKKYFESAEVSWTIWNNARLMEGTMDEARSDWTHFLTGNRGCAEILLGRKQRWIYTFPGKCKAKVAFQIMLSQKFECNVALTKSCWFWSHVFNYEWPTIL